MSTKITFNCVKCGSPDFKIPDNPQPDDIIICVECGKDDTYGSIQTEAQKKVKNIWQEMVTYRCSHLSWQSIK